MDASTARLWISSSRNLAAFTGAGISTESGIPDFRSPNGVWARNRTVDFQEFTTSRAGRVEYWRQKVESWPSMRDAEPNAGHRTLVELERDGRLRALITQNIDGMHQRAGNAASIVIELHGTTAEAACLSCGDRIPMDDAVARVEAGDEAPECARCGGYLKPATISFGQAMPEREMARAVEAARSCEVFLAIGSSLVVQPAAMLPLIAKRAGARLVIVNRTPTPLDEAADCVIRDEIGVVLPMLTGAAVGAA